jgi:hypothetical protein
MSDLSASLAALPPPIQDWLRRLLVADQSERDTASAVLLRSPGGADLADMIEMLSLNPVKRREVVTLLADAG